MRVHDLCVIFLFTMRMNKETSFKRVASRSHWVILRCARDRHTADSTPGGPIKRSWPRGRQKMISDISSPFQFFIFLDFLLPPFVRSLPHPPSRPPSPRPSHAPAIPPPIRFFPSPSLSPSPPRTVHFFFLFLFRPLQPLPRAPPAAPHGPSVRAVRDRAGGQDRDAAEVFDRRLHERCGELGLLGITVQEKFGGSGLDAVVRFLTSFSFARRCLKALFKTWLDCSILASSRRSIRLLRVFVGKCIPLLALFGGFSFCAAPPIFCYCVLSDRMRKQNTASPRYISASSFLPPVSMHTHLLFVNYATK